MERKTVRFINVEREHTPKTPRKTSAPSPCIKNRADRCKYMLDPGGSVLLIWNRVFLILCLASQCIDPLFFFLPLVDNGGPYLCLRFDLHLARVLTILRSMADLAYMIQIMIKFCTAYVDPVSRVLGKGELVTNPRLIARRYVRKGFFIDLAAALPVPQILIWFVTPVVNFNQITKPYLLFIVIQCAIRGYLLIPVSKKIMKAVGFLAKTEWGGTVYNITLYLLASHVTGAIYYLLTVERQATCWESQCSIENINNNNNNNSSSSSNNNIIPCDFKFLECSNTGKQDSQIWANGTDLFANCAASNKSINFNFGIFAFALQFGATTTSLSEKYFYCLWWGFQELTTFGNPLVTSKFIGENLFAIGLTILSLGLFAQLIGSMQIYMRSISANVEGWRTRQIETEQWMKDRQLPRDLRERVSRFLQYKWICTGAVDEESILNDLPQDLRRDIQHHLCLDLVRRVPFFSEIDHQLLEALSERMRPFLRTENTYLIKEGEPVKEMLFLIHGRLESSTTDGGRLGFFNSIILKPGDFCGEELLAWALLANQSEQSSYPCSARTVKSVTVIEAFALLAEDLKIVANRYRRLHNKQLQRIFRFYSHSWRSWAAQSIQAAWRRYKRKKAGKGESSSSRWESFFSLVDQRVIGTTSNRNNNNDDDDVKFEENDDEREGLVNLLVSKIASVFRRAQMERPAEPDFSIDDPIEN